METKELQKLTAANIMTKDVKTISKNATMVEVDNLIEDELIQHVPVLDEDSNIVGIISKSDLQLLKDWGTNLDVGSAKRKNLFLFKSQLASDVMKTNVISVNINDGVLHCIDLLKAHRFHSLPVLEKGKLVGILTTYDLIKAAYLS